MKIHGDPLPYPAYRFEMGPWFYSRYGSSWTQWGGPNGPLYASTPSIKTSVHLDPWVENGSRMCAYVRIKSYGCSAAYTYIVLSIVMVAVCCARHPTTLALIYVYSSLGDRSFDDADARVWRGLPSSL